MRLTFRSGVFKSNLRAAFLRERTSLFLCLLFLAVSHLYGWPWSPEVLISPSLWHLQLNSANKNKNTRTWTQFCWRNCNQNTALNCFCFLSPNVIVCVCVQYLACAHWANSCCQSKLVKIKYPVLSPTIGQYPPKTWTRMSSCFRACSCFDPTVCVRPKSVLHALFISAVL